MDYVKTIMDFMTLCLYLTVLALFLHFITGALGFMAGWTIFGYVPQTPDEASILAFFTMWGITPTGLLFAALCAISLCRDLFRHLTKKPLDVSAIPIPDEENITPYQAEPRRPRRSPRSSPELIAALQELEPEAEKEGSPYLCINPPPWQASIWVVENGKRRLLGHANKISGHLVTNYHVINYAPLENLFLLIIRSGHPTTTIPLEKLKFEVVLEDIVAAPLFDLKMHVPHLKDAPIKNVNGFQPVCIATDYPSQNASMAGLRNHDQAWGLVVYEGSTRPGFSGAGYTHGKGLYGIHSSGGLQNVGYAASYIALKLKRHESSDYYALLSMLEYSSDRNLSHRRASPDEVEVRYQGRYFIIEPEEFADIEEQYLDPPTSARASRRQNRRWRDREEWEAEDPDFNYEHAPRPKVDMQTQTLPLREVDFREDVMTLEGLTICYNDLSRLFEGFKDEVHGLVNYVEDLIEMQNMRFNRILAAIDESAGKQSAPAPAEPPEMIIPPPEQFSEPPSDEEIIQRIEEEQAEMRPRLQQLGLPENSNGSQPSMVGSPSEEQDLIDSLTRELTQVPSNTSQKELTSPGLHQIQEMFNKVLQSMTDLREERKQVFALLAPENSSKSKHTLATGTQQNTQQGRTSSRRRRQRGSKSPAPSTGQPQQALASSSRTQPSRTRSTGMASASTTRRTGNSSNSPQPSASQTSPRASPVAVVPPLASNAQMTSSSSSRRNPTPRRN